MPFTYTFPFYFDDYVYPVQEVLVAFATAPFAATPTWTNINHMGTVLETHTKRGRQHELDRMEAGTAIIVLDNADGDYWPDNVSGDYYPNVVPGKRIFVRLTYRNVVYSVWSGFIEGWDPGWLAKGGIGPITTLRCADVIKNMSRLDLNVAGYAQELSGTRIDNVLDEQSANIGRDLDTGQSNMVATGAIADTKAQAHLFDVQRSELGIMFVAPDADVQFHDRHARLKSPFTTSQATFGDDPGEREYTALQPKYDDEFLRNNIELTRTGGVQQSADDATSQTDYGKRTLSRTDLLLTSDAEVLSQAQYLRARYKDPALRSRTLQVHPQDDETVLFPIIFARDISDRITLRLDQASIDKDYHIESVRHDVRAKSSEWVTQYQLSDADSQAYWAIGVAGYSEIGETTKVAY